MNGRLVTVAQINRTFQLLMRQVSDSIDDGNKMYPAKSTFEESCSIELSWPKYKGTVLVLWYNDETGSTKTMITEVVK